MKNRRPTCNLEHEPLYSPKWDAYFCEECDKWNERACTDEECTFCAARPEKPSMVKDHGEF